MSETCFISTHKSSKVESEINKKKKRQFACEHDRDEAKKKTIRDASEGRHFFFHEIRAVIRRSKHSNVRR